ncbi:MAG: hypothetical protein H6751_13425 [Candidatus Omnitrophica bacterium]|nr:hypothetical protein [Candidatus Omnitrophota bacterium]
MKSLSKLVLGAFLGVLFALTSHPTWGQGTPGYSPSAQDFEFPLQDLDEIKGEIIWLQGGLKRGDPTPYQNPLVPLAAYEQGLLDRDGNLWTFLDNPKGRELRYNKQLRGKEVTVKGWLYDKTQIVEVYSWRDSQAHPVRLDMEYPEPVKVPFEPDKAETIEPIPPVNPEVPGKGMIGEDMWKQKEGLDLIEGKEVAPPSLPDSGQEADLLKRFLDETGSGEVVPKMEDSTENGGQSAIERNSIEGSQTPGEQIRNQRGADGGSLLPPLPNARPNSSSDDRTGTNRIKEGITDPEKIFEESRRALLEQ